MGLLGPLVSVYHLALIYGCSGRISSQLAYAAVRLELALAHLRFRTDEYLRVYCLNPRIL